MDFSGKSVLVTGSTSGIGLGIARCFALLNANVMLNGFGTIAEIASITKEIKDLGKGKVAHSPANLIQNEDVEVLAKNVVDELGSIDILVNNAGMQYVSPIETFPTEKWDQVIALNLSAVFHLIKNTLPYLRGRGWGRIINIASAHGSVASAHKAAYVAAKHGIVGLTKVVGLETAKENITCNAISPGWVLTPLVQKQIEERAAIEGVSKDMVKKELLSGKQPSMQFVKPEDIGDLACFLASESAAQITGAILPIDGGWTAQ